jgi:hypothetical protein
MYLCHSKRDKGDGNRVRPDPLFISQLGRDHLGRHEKHNEGQVMQEMIDSQARASQLWQRMQDRILTLEAKLGIETPATPALDFVKATPGAPAASSSSSSSSPSSSLDAKASAAAAAAALSPAPSSSNSLSKGSLKKKNSKMTMHVKLSAFSDQHASQSESKLISLASPQSTSEPLIDIRTPDAQMNKYWSVPRGPARAAVRAPQWRERADVVCTQFSTAHQRQRARCGLSYGLATAAGGQ